MNIQLNGEIVHYPAATTVADLIVELGISNQKIAIELNQAILPPAMYSQKLADGDCLEIVQAIGGGSVNANDDTFAIAGKQFNSRLLVGTGKYRDLAETAQCIAASGAEIVTVAIRRSNIGQNPDQPNLLEVISPAKYTILPNTAGCFSVADALRTCHLARQLLDGHNLVKLEVLADQKTLFPDMRKTFIAAEKLVADGFEVMVYTNDDPIAAKQLEEIGCVAVMPLAAPIGSGLGIQNPYNILAIVENAKVPILVDAGVGTASDAAVAMELGCGGVLMNTAIACAKQPPLMAKAMRQAIAAGRDAYLAGRMPKRRFASASSPSDGLFF